MRLPPDDYEVLEMLTDLRQYHDSIPDRSETLDGLAKFAVARSLVQRAARMIWDLAFPGSEPFEWITADILLMPDTASGESSAVEPR